jgi:hypothetical protein
VTKRVILSGIAQLFDPLGLIGAILVNVKIILQKVWALKLDWDDSVPMEIYTRWVNFIDSLPAINNINIPRRIISIENPIIIEVHGFCDASELAYGACMYIRAIDKNNRKSSHLLCSKFRVAPLKTISLPRLELCGALLLARLVQKATSKLQLNISKYFYWTDSTIVLSWLASPPTKWQTFVANRVSEIQTLRQAGKWFHVAFKENPAYVVSRSTSPSQLENNTLWFNGPSYLLQNTDEWLTDGPIYMTEIPDKKKASCLVSSHNHYNVILQLIDRYSKFHRLIRAVVILSKFIQYKKLQSRFTSTITVTVLLNRLIFDHK